MERERRFRFYAVTGTQILELLGNWWHHDFISLPKIKGLPDGYRVEAIFPDHIRDAFLLRVYHPSFDPIAETNAIPNYTPIEFETVDMRKREVA